MSLCNHQFVKIEDVTKARSASAASWDGMIPGALVVCALCGQVRKLWGDGSGPQIADLGMGAIDEDHVEPRGD